MEFSIHVGYYRSFYISDEKKYELESNLGMLGPDRGQCWERCHESQFTNQDLNSRPKIQRSHRGLAY